MAKKFEYVASCRGRTMEPEQIEAHDIEDAIWDIQAKLDSDHEDADHTILSIKQIGEVEDKRFAVRANEEVLSARLLVRPDDGEDRWYDLEVAASLAEMAQEFRRLESTGYKLVNERDLDD